MSKRSSKKVIQSPAATGPAQWLRAALAKRTKGELIDMLVEMGRDDRVVLRRLTARFDLHAPLDELLVATRRAIAAASHTQRR